MLAHLNTAVDSHPDGILSTVPDAHVVEGPLRRAIADGIPVIAVNAADPRPEAQRIPYLLYVGANDTIGGETAATRLLEPAIPARAICVDHYMTDNACHNQRWAGFRTSHGGRGLQAKRVRVPGDDQPRAVELLAAALRGDGPLAVCTLGPPGASIAIEATEREQLGEGIVHGSFDLAPAQLDAVVAGSLLFTVDSQQYLQGSPRDRAA